MSQFLPTDPTVQLLLHVATFLVAWYLRHKGINVPLLPNATPDAPAAPAAPTDRPVVDLVRKVLREELLPLLRKAAEEAMAEKLADAKRV